MATDPQQPPIGEPLTGAQLTLLTTPTGGASGEHSPYYRRLLSAGYKGFLQGIVGGATLYGLIGAVLGGLFALATGLWAAVPVLGILGLIKGADTFGNIGSVAAISAESAETSERRRYLLDRYYSLPNETEYRAEAFQIQKMLQTQHETHPPLGLFHWKTMLICAALGAALFGGLAVLAPTVGFAGELLSMLHLTELGLAGSLGAGATLGGLIGSMIGLDRYYVRRWFDQTETLLSDGTRDRIDQMARAREVDILEDVSPDRDVPKQTVRVEIREPNSRKRPAEIVSQSQPQNQRPGNRVSTVQLDSPVSAVQAAMDRPVV